jgi:arylsulfatase A-like enzyme
MTLANKAAQFIQRAASKGPFLLNYWSPAVHLPHTPPRQWGKNYISGTTPSPHLDMVKVLDKEVKTIVEALQVNGVYDNTLIIFTSDNGGLADSITREAGHSSPGNLRGSKNAPYEGGHRTPFIVSWPGNVGPGTLSHAMVNGTDLVATVAAITGVAVKSEQAKDSWNLLPLLRGEEGAPERTEMLLQAGSKRQLIYRSGNWKLIIQTDDKLTTMEPIALFDLSDNPQEKEQQNLISSPKYKDRIIQMFERYKKIRKSGIRTAPLI